jgi:hypothetical protein
MPNRADEPKYSMPDGSYPINNCADVSDAAKLAHHSKTYSFDKVKAMVLKAKAGLGCPDSVLPDTWDEENSVHPRDGVKGCLVRSVFGEGAIELRQPEADSTGTELFGHFSKFNTWYKVDSAWEGTFMERVAPGAFSKTIAEDSSSMRVTFNHGMDPVMGNKPLGPIKTLQEDDQGAYYEVPLLDTDYNKDFLVPALEGRLLDGTKVGSQLGASFRFEVVNDKWERGKTNSANPDGLDRRTITEARVFEFGPVTYPASGAATAGIRSATDDFMEHLLHDGRFVAGLIEQTSPRVVGRMLAAAREHLGAASDDEDEGRENLGSKRLLQLRRQAEAILLFGVDNV